MNVAEHNKGLLKVLISELEKKENNMTECTDFVNVNSKNDKTYDPVHRPSHYTEGRKYEPKDVIHDWRLSWNLGNAVKYISRAGRKGDAIEDLHKAIEYIKYEIECLKEGDYGSKEG